MIDRLNSQDPESPAFRSRLLICGVAFLLSLAPVASGSLWWNICRGRVVSGMGGDASAELIQQEELPDSDVLAGTVPWLIFESSGVDGLMVAKLVLSVLVGCLLSMHCRHSSAPLIVVAVLVSCRPALEPDQAIFDLLAVLVCWRLAVKERLVLVGLFSALWCNYSIGAIWCLPTAWVSAAVKGRPLRRQMMAVFSVCCGLCINLRGPVAIWEMLQVSAPFGFYDRRLLADFGFGPVTFSLPAVCSIGLCVCAVLAGRSNPATKVILFLCGLTSIFNVRVLPLTAMISGLLLLDFGAAFVKPHRGKLTAAQRMISWGGRAIAAAAVLTLMAGGLNGQAERFGWGIADSLDYRLVERDLQKYADSSVLAHGSDTNATGLLLLALPKSEVVDVAETAIKRGRFERLAMLNYDLSTGRKTAYVRSDGNMGGWWNSLINGNVELLMISAEHTQIFAALEPTLWRPLTLDSPAIVLGQAGSPRFIRQIIDTMKQRDIVDSGGWQHQLSATTPNRSHADFWQVLTGMMDSRPDIRQARVFRSMGMFNAAARTIIPVVGGRCRPSGVAEFQGIQKQLSWQEQLYSGSISEWRRAVLNSLACPLDENGGSMVAEVSTEPDSAHRSFSPEAIQLYCSGLPEKAAEMVKGVTPERLFALHTLHWHAGDLQEAERILQAMRANYADHSLTLAAEWERGFHQQQ